MDSGALTLPATPVPSNPYNNAQDESQRLTGANHRPDSPSPATMFDDFSFPEMAPNTDLDTPIHRPSLNHFEASNLRQFAENQPIPQTPDAQAALPAFPAETPASAADDLSAIPPSIDDTFLHGHGDIYEQYNSALDGMVMDDPDQDGTTQFTEDIEEPEHEPMQAYAKLCLPDGDYFVKSLQVILGRDMDYFKEWLKEKKRAQRAQKALDEYALEPSQPSQPDDAEPARGPSSKSSQSLVGRPARGLPSHYSEQGGAVSYAAADSDEEFQSKLSRRKRRLLNETASSTASIAPAHLHPNLMGDFSGTEAAQEEPAPERIHVHPKNRADIAKISKDHLLFTYSFDNERWEVHILGRWAFVNSVLHEKGAVIPLQHGDNIMVTSLTMEFKLPENYRHSPGVSRGTFADSDLELSELDDESIFDTSPAARKASEIDDPKRPKLKLKLGKKKADKTKDDETTKTNDQTDQPTVKQEQDVQVLEKSPEVFKKPGKKPVATAPEAVPALVKQPTEESAAGDTPVQGPANIEPGSIFEGVAAEELPQKRKGPGRPPKNGLISKRDQSFVKRKLKEYEKRGEAPPPMDELVAIVRAENKAKEMAAKAAQRGEAPPDASIVQSIESDLLSGASKIDPSLLSDTTPTTAPTPSEPVRRPSPKPKRVARSPSPMKPETDYTEEELKKPTMTYVHILDEILRDHEDGKADLQEIYDRICKRYPYFKYRVSTAGWQSSVRHNLLQHDRFMENGRSGKGRLWAINHNCPIDKEKKRRITPPPRPPMPQMQNGQFPPGQHGHMPQYGQPNYNTQYGPPGQNRPPQFQHGAQGPQGGYYTPYAHQQGQGGQYGHPQGQHMGGMNQQRPPQNAPPGHHPPNGPPNGQQQPQQPPAQNPPAQHPPFQPFVEEIMVYRSQYLSHFTPGSEAFNTHEEIFKKCTSFISELFHGTSATVKDRLANEEEKSVFRHLEVLYERYRHLSQPAGKTPTPAAKTPAPDAAGTASGAQQPAPQQGQAQPQAQQGQAQPVQQQQPGPPQQVQQPQGQVQPGQPQPQPQTQAPAQPQLQGQAPPQAQGSPMQGVVATGPGQPAPQAPANRPPSAPSNMTSVPGPGPITNNAPPFAPHQPPAAPQQQPATTQPPPANVQQAPQQMQQPPPPVQNPPQMAQQPPPPQPSVPGPATTAPPSTAQQPIVVPDDPEPKPQPSAQRAPSTPNTAAPQPAGSVPPSAPATTVNSAPSAPPAPIAPLAAEQTGTKRAADDSVDANGTAGEEQDAKRVKMG